MKKPMEKHLTLREKILENIRDAIVSGSLKAGSRVSEPELAERYGISRTPIREAFRQLESEGYLTVIPRRGAIVSDLSPKDVEEFYAIKSIMEGYAARRACENLSGKDLDRLQVFVSFDNNVCGFRRFIRWAEHVAGAFAGNYQSDAN